MSLPPGRWCYEAVHQADAVVAAAAAGQLLCGAGRQQTMRGENAAAAASAAVDRDAAAGERTENDAC